MPRLWLSVALLAAAAVEAHYLADGGGNGLAISSEEALERLEQLALQIDQGGRVKRQEQPGSYDGDRGVTNLDIRDAILQLLAVVREGNKKLTRQEEKTREVNEDILDKLKESGSTSGMNRKIDNISTFLLRMNSKLESIERRVKRGGRGGSGDLLETLAQESFDILTLLPTYIEAAKDAVNKMAKESTTNFNSLENLLVDDGFDGPNGKRRSLAKIIKGTETKILGASAELKEIVMESGHMAESLFERVNEGYSELTSEIKGLSNVEKVLVDTADAVMDTKRKIEFGVQQIIFKVSELVKLSGGQIDEQLKDQFADITQTILSNQTEALGNLTKKVEKEIGQVWRQMGIMYSQVSNSIKILEKVKSSTESYVNNTGKNLGTMEGQVEGLTDRMVDVDSNLNYMLGQLSLVVQEFNQVKTGLGEAMSGLSDELDDITEYKRPGEEEQEAAGG